MNRPILLAVCLLISSVAFSADTPAQSGYKITEPGKATPVKPGSAEEASEIAAIHLARSNIRINSVQIAQGSDTAAVASIVGEKPCTVILSRTDYGRQPFSLPIHNVEYFGWEVKSTTCASK
jgi:hypothetical protein